MNSIKFDCLAGSRLSEVLTSIRLVNDREKSSRHTSNDITDNGGLTNQLVELTQIFYSGSCAKNYLLAISLILIP